jgi:hypothetical protein
MTWFLRDSGRRRREGKDVPSFITMPSLNRLARHYERGDPLPSANDRNPFMAGLGDDVAQRYAPSRRR